MPEKTTPAKKTAAARPPAVVPDPAPAVPKGKAEVVRWAYVLGTDGKSYVDTVTFGTDTARTDFLREHADQWWRILDAAKGTSLHAALNQVASNA